MRYTEIDIFELNYNYSSERIGIFNTSSYPHLIFKRSLFYSIPMFFIIWCLRSIRYFKSNKKAKQKKGVIFLAFTLNQKNASLKIRRAMKDGHLIGNKHADYTLPEHKAFLYSMPYFFVCFKRFLKSNGYQKKSMRFAFWHYWLTYGYVKMLNRELKNAKAVVVANDHTLMTKSTNLVCEELNIPCIYIQHSSIGAKYPRLKMMYSLLDSRYSLHQYLNIGTCDSQVYILGNLHANRVNNEANDTDTIGFCFSVLDDQELILKALQFIKQRNQKIYVRHHPGEKRQKLLLSISSMNIEISNPNFESLSDFFNKVEFIISGDSNILRDALEHSREPVYYQMNEKLQYDYYGFIKNGLVIHQIENVAQAQFDKLLEKINLTKKSIRERLKTLDESIGTEYESKNEFLYVEAIREIISQKDSSDLFEKDDYLGVQIKRPKHV